MRFEMLPFVLKLTLMMSAGGCAFIAYSLVAMNRFMKEAHNPVYTKLYSMMSAGALLLFTSLTIRLAYYLEV